MSSLLKANDALRREARLYATAGPDAFNSLNKITEKLGSDTLKTIIEIDAVLKVLGPNAIDTIIIHLEDVATMEAFRAECSKPFVPAEALPAMAQEPSSPCWRICHRMFVAHSEYVSLYNQFSRAGDAHHGKDFHEALEHVLSTVENTYRVANDGTCLPEAITCMRSVLESIDVLIKAMQVGTERFGEWAISTARLAREKTLSDYNAIYDEYYLLSNPVVISRYQPDPAVVAPASAPASAPAAPASAPAAAPASTPASAPAASAPASDAYARVYHPNWDRIDFCMKNVASHLSHIKYQFPNDGSHVRTEYNRLIALLNADLAQFRTARAVYDSNATRKALIAIYANLGELLNFVRGGGDQFSGWVTATVDHAYGEAGSAKNAIR